MRHLPLGSPGGLNICERRTVRVRRAQTSLWLRYRNARRIEKVVSFGRLSVAIKMKFLFADSPEVTLIQQLTRFTLSYGQLGVTG